MQPNSAPADLHGQKSQALTPCLSPSAPAAQRPRRSERHARRRGRQTPAPAQSRHLLRRPDGGKAGRAGSDQASWKRQHQRPPKKYCSTFLQPRGRVPAARAEPRWRKLKGRSACLQVHSGGAMGSPTHSQALLNPHLHCCDDRLRHLPHLFHQPAQQLLRAHVLIVPGLAPYARLRGLAGRKAPARHKRTKRG